MGVLFASGHAADILLAVLLIEAMWLALRRRRWTQIASAVMPGVFFALALRAALTGAGWPLVALPLMLAGVAHIIDLRLRRLAVRPGG